MSKGRAWLVPLCTGLFLMVCVIILFGTLNKREDQILIEKTHNQAKKVISYITSDLYSRVLSMERMARRWEMRGGMSENEFLSDSRRHIKDAPGFKVIQFVDKDFRIKWIEPLQGNENLIGIAVNFEKNRATAIAKAINKRTPSLTPPILLLQGGIGIQIYVPVFIKKQLNGFIVGVLDVDSWIKYVLDQKESQYEKTYFSANIFIDKINILQQNKLVDLDEKYRVIDQHEFLDHEIAVELTPTDVFSAANGGLVSYITLISGILLSLLITIAMYLIQRTVGQNKEIGSANEMLRDRTRLLTMATHAGQVGIWTWKIKSGNLIWNDIMYDIYGIDQSVVPVYETWSNALYPDDKERTEKLLHRALAGKGTYDTEFRIIRPNGEVRYIKAAADLEYDEHGKVILITGINVDITEKENAAMQLSTEKKKLQYVIKGTDVGTWEWNVQTNEVEFDERWADILGYKLDELRPLSFATWERHCHPEDLIVAKKLLDRHFNGELDHYDCEIRMRHKNGSWIWVHARGKVATWTATKKPLLMFGTHQEITQRKLNEEQIFHQANYDVLTQLPIRRFAEQEMSLLMATANRNQKLLAVLFVDLDGFKFINDNYGHDIGDKVLIKIADILKGCIRKDDIVSRIGGDEFIIVLSNLGTRDNAEQIAKMTIERISTPMVIDSHELNVSASIGIAIYPDDGRNSSGLIKRADDAMYRIKNKGKNNFVFFS